MDNWNVIILIIGILLLGLIHVLSRHVKRVKRINFIIDYHEKFNKFTAEYFSSGKHITDVESYLWLSKNVDKVQDYLGTLGLMDYKPAFQNYIIPDYQLIINTMPKFRNGRINEFEFGAVDNSLLRYIGSSEEAIKTSFRRLLNPMVWFKVGIQEILSFPVILVSWTGLMQRSTVDSIKSSDLFRILSGTVTLVSFIGGVMSIIIGYDQTIQFVMSLWKDIMQ